MERIQMDINTFMKHLHMYRAPRVFNPWREYEPGLDIGPEAPQIRYGNLQRYLELRRNATTFLLRKVWAIREAAFPAWP